MFRRVGVGVAGAVALVCAAVQPATAPAAETLGSVSDFAGSCGDNAAYVGPSVASGPDYFADAAGVVTTYSVLAADNQLATFRLLVLQPEAGTNYTVTQQDAPRAQTVDDAVNTQTGIHLPIAAGQTIGLFVPDGQPSGNGNCLAATGNALDIFRLFNGEPPFGTSSMWSANQTTVRMNLAATVEPDTDKDTFGDETQDKCIGTAGPFNGCPNTVTAIKLKQKGDTKVRATLTVPGAGSLEVGSSSDPALASASAKRSVKVVTRTLTATTQQRLKLTLKLTKSAIGKLSDAGKLKLKVKAVYTPEGGPPGARTKKTKLKT